MRHPGADPDGSNPRRVGLVTALYVLLNYTFLRAVPAAELAGVVEVGALTARHTFGPAGAALASALIAALLVATVSGMLLAGSRVTQAVAAGMAREAGVGHLGARTAGGVPRNAVIGQALLVAALLLYTALSLWTLGFVLRERPAESLVGLATVLAGVPVWWAWGRGEASSGRPWTG